MAELKGIIGVSGRQGPVGPQGPQGEKGDKGDAGVSVSVGTTTTGAAGTQASVTNTGTASDPILNFTIPQGIQGETGATGPQGPQGATGADGKVQDVLFNGTSVLSGSNASIEVNPNVADTYTARLNKLKIQGICYALQGGGALVFSTYSAMVTDLNARASGDLGLGYNIYVATVDVPDLWIQVNNESTSVAYTYTTDEQFITDLNTAGTSGLQIGYYRVNKLESEKVVAGVQDVQLAGTSIVSGNVANIPLATTSANGIMSSTDKTNLDNAILDTAQSLTDAEQTQARQNINAFTVEYGTEAPTELDEGTLFIVYNNL